MLLCAVVINQAHVEFVFIECKADILCQLSIIMYFVCQFYSRNDDCVS